jgi:hypothetical protein
MLLAISLNFICISSLRLVCQELNFYSNNQMRAGGWQPSSFNCNPIGFNEKIGFYISCASFVFPLLDFVLLDLETLLEPSAYLPHLLCVRSLCVRSFTVGEVIFWLDFLPPSSRAEFSARKVFPGARSLSSSWASGHRSDCLVFFSPAS